MMEPHAPVSARGGHLRFVPAFLGDVGHPKPSYVLKSWLLTLLPSLALAAIVGMFAGDAATPEFGAPGLLLLFALVVFAPVVETLIMVPPLLLLNRLFGPAAAVILSALGWGIAHSLQAPIWGLIVWWPFFVFSSILLVWRKKSLATGMALVMAVHALQNAVPAALLISGLSQG
jgi:membrane protease YdiL (CAAX protease family)